MLDILDIVRLHVGMKSSAESDHLTIGQVAEHFGLATHVLRHWEAAGLLTPPRAASGQRLYQPVDLYRVAAILRGKEAGLALDDIRAMTAGADPATRATILRQQRDDLARHIARAQASLALIETALRCQHGDVVTCPDFQALLAERADHHYDEP